MITRLKHNWLYIFFFVYAFIFLFIFSKSSPLYVFNDWVDPNVYFTIGKGIMHGLVPFKDLFDAKGPLIFLLYGIGYLMDHTGFTGIYILESLALFASMVLFQKISRHYLPTAWQLLGSLTMPSLLVIYTYFNDGGSAEEFMIPCIFYLFYQIFEFTNRNQNTKLPYQVDLKAIYLLGLTMGITFWIKYTNSFFWLGFFFALTIILLKKRQFKDWFKLVGSALAGYLTITIPVLLYFALNHALNDLFFSYFQLNIKLYGSAELTTAGQSWGGKILHMLEVLFWMPVTDHSPILAILFILALVMVPLSKLLPNWESRLLYLFSFLSGSLILFWGTFPMDYYRLSLIPAMSMGLLWIFFLFNRASFLKQPQWRNTFVAILVVSAIVFACFSNSNYLQSKLNPHAQKSAPVEFAKIINQTPNSTVLNYRMLDLGVYTAANKIPTTKYFTMINFGTPKNLPEAFIAQDKIVGNQQVDFLVTRTLAHTKVKGNWLLQRYHPIKHQAMVSDKGSYTYWLLAKTNSTTKH